VGGTLVTTLDGCAALTILLTWQALWAWRWWRRHRHQVRALAGQRRQARGGDTHGKRLPDLGHRG
jgi:hypothetical protein